MVSNLPGYTLVDKELVKKNDKWYYKLYLYDSLEGVVLQVFAPIIQKEVVLINDRLENNE
jgi:hypothetical protein